MAGGESFFDKLAPGRSGLALPVSPAPVVLSRAPDEIVEGDGNVDALALRGVRRARFTNVEAVCALQVPFLSDLAGSGSGVPVGLTRPE